MKELDEIRKDMQRLFDEFFEPPHRRRRFWPRPAEAGVIVPNIEMYDRKNEIVIKAELPGVNKEDIDLTVTKDSLTLRGELKQEEEINDEDYYSAEISYGSFARTIPLPVEVDSAKAKATFKNGVLQIVLPKREEVKPKEIKVEVS
jgi:HSP20 family protein